MNFIQKNKNQVYLHVFDILNYIISFETKKDSATTQLLYFLGHFV